MACLGKAATCAEAKQQLVDALRAWAVWGGLRQLDVAGPVAPRRVLTKNHRPHDPSLDARIDTSLLD